MIKIMVNMLMKVNKAEKYKPTVKEHKNISD